MRLWGKPKVLVCALLPAWKTCLWLGPFIIFFFSWLGKRSHCPCLVRVLYGERLPDQVGWFNFGRSHLINVSLSLDLAVSYIIFRVSAGLGKVQVFVRGGLAGYSIGSSSMSWKRQKKFLRYCGEDYKIASCMKRKKDLTVAIFMIKVKFAVL